MVIDVKGFNSKKYYLKEVSFGFNLLISYTVNAFYYSWIEGVGVSSLSSIKGFFI